MVRIILLTVAAIVPASFAWAQDISPVITPGQAAEGIYYRSMMEEQAARDRRRKGSGAQAEAAAPRPGTPEFQRRVCADRPVYRRQYGAQHPKVQQLERLCAQAGY